MRILDQFDYHVRLTADLFEPEIPEGFVKAHPDEIRAERERREKSDMVYADVPEGLKEELVAALNQIETASYRESATTRVYLTRHAWRVDRYDGDDLKQVQWFVISKEDMTPTSFDFNDKAFCLTHTTVDFESQTYKHVAHGRDTRPPHPMDMIRFLVGQVDRADRILDDALIDGTACIGLEISAKKYGTNPDHMIHRLWFGLRTHLPVRMELDYLPDGATEKVVRVKDQFEWNPAFAPAFFVPEIPPGFTAAEDSDGG